MPLAPLPMITAYIGLGANLGDAHATLVSAVKTLTNTPEIFSVQLSPLYRTAPIDAGGPDYINAVVSLATTLEADALLTTLQRIETQHGRQRPYRNAPRTLDLDLLLYGEARINEAHLTVPHPRMHERAFVLKPLSDLAPDLQLPWGSVGALLMQHADQPLSRL